MKITSDFKDLLSSLNSFQVEYLLIGGFAVILHTEPRYTKDLDVWVNPNRENASKVYAALSNFGAPLAQLGIVRSDFEREGYFVQFGREPARVDILMGVKGMKFSDAFQNRVEMKLGEVVVPVISREDLISVKLETARPQDLIDAANLKKGKKQLSHSSV